VNGVLVPFVLKDFHLVIPPIELLLHRGLCWGGLLLGFRLLLFLIRSAVEILGQIPEIISRKGFGKGSQEAFEERTELGSILPRKDLLGEQRGEAVKVSLGLGFWERIQEARSAGHGLGLGLGESGIVDSSHHHVALDGKWCLSLHDTDAEEIVDGFHVGFLLETLQTSLLRQWIGQLHVDRGGRGFGGGSGGGG